MATAVLAGFLRSLAAPAAALGAIEGVARVAELLDPAILGRGFGLVALVDGVGDLVSSVVVGVLFTVTSRAWGFAYAVALWSAGAIVLAADRPGRTIVEKP